MYYSEMQRLRDVRWIWILFVVLGCAALVPLGSALYSQLVIGEPWGNKPMSDKGLIALTIGVVLALASTATLLLLTTYEIRIDDKGISWRFVPYRIRWQHIPTSEVTTLTFVPWKITKGRSYGYHRHIFKRRRSMIVKGDVAMNVALRGGESYFFGTAFPGEMERAARKMLEHKQK